MALWRKGLDEEAHDLRAEARKIKRAEQDERRKKRHEDGSDSDEVISDDTDFADIYNFMKCMNADDENEDDDGM